MKNSNQEEREVSRGLDLCSKRGDIHGALEIFDKATKEKTSLKLKERHYNVLLYLCSSAASATLRRFDTSKPGDREREREEREREKDGEREREKGEEKREKEKEKGELVPVSEETKALALRRGCEIYEHMRAQGTSLNEAAFTSVARLAEAKGDGDLAFELVKKMLEAKITPRLRSYGPALFSYCKSGQAEKAFEVEAHMLGRGVRPEENELSALLKVSAEAAMEDKVYSVLHNLRTSVRELSPSTIQIIEDWFKSEAASLVGCNVQGSLTSEEAAREAVEVNGGGWHGLGWLGTGKWRVERTSIDKIGRCCCCGEQLRAADIDPLETEKLANSIFKMACEREPTPGHFQGFQSWLSEAQPLHAVVDAANIGFFRQNFAGGGFSVKQVKAVVEEIQAVSPGNRLPLVVLHERRIRDSEASSAKSRALLQGWSQAKALFSTPAYANDDWYWLYAAVKLKCLLVTNDEMRDHIFWTLGNDFFPKWKERHQVRYTSRDGKVVLHMPPPYSIIIQESASGSWHIPQAGGDDITIPREWLCSTRDGSLKTVPSQKRAKSRSPGRSPSPKMKVRKTGLEMPKCSEEGDKNGHIFELKVDGCPQKGEEKA